MKKILLLLFLLLSQLTYGQKIELDKTEGENRFIFCSHQNIRDMKDKTVLYVALFASKHKDVIFL